MNHLNHLNKLKESAILSGKSRSVASCLIVLAIAGAILSAQTRIAEANTIYFQGDAESGTLSPPWGNPIGSGISITSEVVHSGNKAYKHDIPANFTDSQRHSKLLVFKEAKNKEAYYSNWYYIAEGYDDDGSDWRNNTQFKTNNGGDTTIKGGPKVGIGFSFPRLGGRGVRELRMVITECDLSVQDLQSIGLGVKFEAGGGSCKFRQINPTPIPKKKWFHIELFYRQGKTNGKVVLWLDGVEIFNIAHPNLNTLTTCAELPDNTKDCTRRSNNQYLYYVIGNYVSKNAVGRQLLYTDDALITDYRVGPGTTPNLIPTPSLSANPSSLLQGEQSTLSWSATNATSCSINQNIGTVCSSSSSCTSGGTRTVSPSVTTTYAMTCSGSGGTNTASTQITVGSQRPSYTAFTVLSPPTIDGNLSEFTNANSITLQGTINDNTGTYKLLHDANNLYIGATVQDPNLSASITTRDGQLWNDDSIELFFDTARNRGSAQMPNTDDYKFFVNILNTQNDTRGGGIGSSFNASFASQALPNGTIMNSTDADSGYTIEMSIPWSSLNLSPPPANSAWGFDLAMNDADIDTIDDANTEFEKVEWANTNGGTSNDPDGWGDMIFSSTAVGSPPSTSPCNLLTSQSDYNPLPQPLQWLSSFVGKSYDVFNLSKLFASVTCPSLSSPTLTIKGSSPQYQVLWHEIYIRKENASNWEKMTVSGPSLQNSIIWKDIGNSNQITHTLSSLTQQDLSNTTALLFYICTWNGTRWACGCEDTQCATPKWQLQGIRKYER